MKNIFREFGTYFLALIIGIIVYVAFVFALTFFQNSSIFEFFAHDIRSDIPYLSKKISSSETLKIEEKPMSKTHALRISTVPNNAVIKIMNIKPAFHQGMQLENGNYHIQILLRGYKTKELWIKIEDKDVTLKVNLEKNKGE